MRSASSHVFHYDTVRYSQYVRECIVRILNTSTRSSLLKFLPPSPQQPRTPRSPRRHPRLSKLAFHKAGKLASHKSLWLNYLPPEIRDRLATIAYARGDITTLLNLAEAAPCMHDAVLDALQATLTIDAHTIPHAKRWAHLLHSGVQIVVVDRRIRQYNPSFILPPLVHLLAAPTLHSATIPALPRLLTLLAHAPALTSLGVYLRNQEDALTLVTASASSPAAFNSVRDLALLCTGPDKDDVQNPFCLSAQCASEHLCQPGLRHQLRERFTQVRQLTLRCGHPMPGDVWPLVTAFPRLRMLHLDVATELPDGALRTLRALDSVSLKRVRDAARLSAKLGCRVRSLVLHERVLEECDLRALAPCTQLHELQVALAEGAERALPPLVKTVHTLALRWGYTDGEVSMARAHARTAATTSWCKAESASLRAIAQAAQKVQRLHLELVQVSKRDLQTMLQVRGATLRHLTTTLEGQRDTADKQLSTVMQLVMQYCGGLESLGFCELSEGSEHRYDVGLRGMRKRDLQRELRTLRSRAPVLRTDAVEEAVARMCGKRRAGWTWS